LGSNIAIILINNFGQILLMEYAMVK